MAMELVDGFIDRLVADAPSLAACRGSISAACEMLLASFRAGNKLLICGNGGSAADAEHIAGELMKGFLKPRPVSRELLAKARAVCAPCDCAPLEQLQAGLPAIALTTHTALITAVLNDQQADLIFAQQVLALGRAGDVLLAVSTSGDARNVILAVVLAKAMGLKCLGLTGYSGGRLRGLCDVTMAVPSTETPKTQAMHILVYHALCAAIEEALFAS